MGEIQRRRTSDSALCDCFKCKQLQKHPASNSTHQVLVDVNQTVLSLFLTVKNYVKEGIVLPQTEY